MLPATFQIFWQCWRFVVVVLQSVSFSYDLSCAGVSPGLFSGTPLSGLPVPTGIYVGAATLRHPAFLFMTCTQCTMAKSDAVQGLSGVFAVVMALWKRCHGAGRQGH